MEKMVLPLKLDKPGPRVVEHILDDLEDNPHQLGLCNCLQEIQHSPGGASKRHARIREAAFGHLGLAITVVDELVALEGTVLKGGVVEGDFLIFLNARFSVTVIGWTAFCGRRLRHQSYPKRIDVSNTDNLQPFAFRPSAALLLLSKR